MTTSVLVLLLVVFKVGEAIECPDDWISFRGSCYLLINDLATWPGAQTICSLLNANLVEIESADENEFIVSQMALRKVTKTWTGLNDFEHEGRFVWTSNGEIPEYTNWASGEPNDDATNPQLGDQDCGALYGTGKWDDEYCESSVRFQLFCEITSQGGSIIG